MKRSERHHLKDNELVSLAENAREAFEANKKQSVALVAAVAIIAVAAAGLFGWRARVQGQSHSMLAQALAVVDASVGPLPSPDSKGPAPRFRTEAQRSEAALAKLREVADAYPSTDAGLYARYLQGNTLVALGKPADAVKAYQQVVDRDSKGLTGQMARLGLAEAQARTGQFDQAIATFKQLAQQKEGAMPVDAVLMELGRVYRDAGKPSDAQQTFSRVVEEFPQSPFSADAKRELDNLKKS